MKYSRYSLSFGAVVLLLTLGATITYREISVRSLAAQREDLTLRWPDDTLPTPAASAVTATDFGAIAAADESWRQRNAKAYSLNELRVRGDGRRTPRQMMQDRVYGLTRSGDRARATAELERWVESHPRDVEALLWLARLLNEGGRSNDSVKRYRQALALESANDAQ